MIKFKIDITRYGTVEFACPYCGVIDVLYVTMPGHCWTCGGPYRFNIAELLKHRRERAHFHFHEETSDCHD